MSADLHIYDDPGALSAGFTGFFKELVEVGEDPMHVALSGGSTPRGWFDFLACNERDWPHWTKVQLYWGDERCVPPDSAESNYGMTRHHLLNAVPGIAKHQVHRIHGELDPEEAASRYRTVLDTGLPKRQHLPRFDLVILGVGSDGHTASIFPVQLHRWNSDLWCFATTHPETKQSRVTLSGKVINNASHVVFLVQGAEKAPVLGAIHNRAHGHRDYPAAHVRPVHGRLHWFMDREAAKEITS